MSIPAWIPGIFALVMLLAAEASAGQLLAARAWTRRGRAGAHIAVSQLLTGIAMAGLLVPGLSALPNAAWEFVFAVMTAWFLCCLWRESGGRAVAVARGHYAPYLVHSAAMLYLFAALAAPPAEGSGMSMSGMDGMPGTAGMSSGGMPALQAPALALIFTLLLVAFTVHDLDRRAGADGYFHVPGRPSGPAGPAPGQPTAAHIAERLLLSPAMVKGCRVATGVAMAFALIIMI